ncbi:MAG: D-alanyl-D-alanine carboxypeptidase [Oscillospiraceae bacterium]|nr:D-alanyl-D-alanine carboxypeptidase [Oscillospiraceae bacterium]
MKKESLSDCVKSFKFKIRPAIKRVFVVIVAVSMIASALTTKAFAYAEYDPGFEVNSEAAYMVCLNTGDVVYQKNADKKLMPASLVDIMTAILALEKVEDPDSESNTLKRYIQDHLYVIGNVALGGVSLNERLTITQMLYAMMLRSANECAMMIADYVGDGSQTYFVEMMNNKARELGAKNTNFANASGLDSEEQYTTAEDMYLIAKYALEVEGFKDIVKTVTYNTGETNKHSNLQWQTNMAIINPNSSYYYSPVTGLKFGSTDGAGRCFVSYAEMNGYSYILVLMGADSKNKEKNLSFTDAKNLYNWAFNTFSVKKVVEVGRQITEEPVKMSTESDYVMLITGGEFSYLLPESVKVSDITLDYSGLPEYVTAPVEKGEVIGELKIILGGEKIGSVPLVAVKKIEKSELLSTIESIKGIFRSFWFKFGVVFFVLTILFYIAVMIIRNKNQKRYSNAKRPRYK